MKRRGFTLIEMIIVMSIFAIFITLTSGLINEIIKQKRRHSAQLLVNQQARNAIEAITRDIKVAFGTTDQAALNAVATDGVLDPGALDIRQSGAVEKIYQQVDSTNGNKKIVLSHKAYTGRPVVKLAAADIAIIVDLTGSMTESVASSAMAGTTTTKYAALKVALRAFIQKLRDTETAAGPEYVGKVFNVGIIPYPARLSMGMGDPRPLTNIYDDSCPYTDDSYESKPTFHFLGTPDANDDYLRRTTGTLDKFFIDYGALSPSSTTCMGGGLYQTNKFIDMKGKGVNARPAKDSSNNKIPNIGVLMSDGCANRPYNAAGRKFCTSWWDDDIFGIEKHLPGLNGNPLYTMYSVAFGKDEKDISNQPGDAKAICDYRYSNFTYLPDWECMDFLTLEKIVDSTNKLLPPKEQGRAVKARNAEDLAAAYTQIAGEIKAQVTTEYIPNAPESYDEIDLTSEDVNVKDLNFNVTNTGGWPYVTIKLTIDNGLPPASPRYAQATVNTVISSRGYR